MTEHPGEEVPALRDRLARVIYTQGAYCGDCEFDGWDSCEECRRCVLGYTDAVLDALGIERLGLMGANPTTIDSLAWGHRYNIGDRVVSVSDRRLYDRDVPLFRIRALEHLGGDAEVDQ